MPKLVGKLWSSLLLVIFAAPVGATSLIDTLDKQFKRIDYPNGQVMARISIKTEVGSLSSDHANDSLLLAYSTHAKLVATFKQNGWSDNDHLATDFMDAGLIELEIGEGMNLKLKETLRLKAYIHQCDSPMVKYRGGSLDAFFQKEVLENSERCFTDNAKLQGKNYPY